MFYSLTGKIVYTDASCFAIDVNGVAFKCFATLNTIKRLGAVGETATVYTHLNVKEDAMDLFGFYDNAELEFFKLLNTVNGVGPKGALSILSELTPEKLVLCIASGDVKAITRAPGVGSKIAQRIVLELKNKVAKNMESMTSGDFIQDEGSLASGSAMEAVSALVALGYSQTDAAQVVAKLDGSLPVEQMIKNALKYLAG